MRRLRRFRSMETPRQLEPACPIVRRSAAARGGFSLLELLVATALMAIAIIGLLTLVSTSLSNAVVVRDYDRAAMLGKAKLNELLAVSPIPIGQPMSGRYDEAWRWEAVVTPFEAVPPARVGGQIVLRVQVLVAWQNAINARQSEFVGYRTIRLQPEDENILSEFR
jgi:general secretion pathway protein I